MMRRDASSCESTAPSISPSPLRWGRRRSKIEEDIYPYKLFATVILTLHALADAGISIGAEELRELSRCLKELLGSSRDMTTLRGNNERVMDEPSEVLITGTPHIAQWNSALDRIFIDAMLEHETSWAGSTFTVPGWHSIVKTFNEVSCFSYTKLQMQHRWKNMKKDYASYLYLRNKSGWGWDIIYNMPIPPSEDAWFELADRYHKYRNKPFLYFGDIQRILSKDIATGMHATSSRSARDKQPVGASNSQPHASQRELNFDEYLDECMSEQLEDVDDSDEMSPTPSSRKRNTCGRHTSSKKSRSGGTMNAAYQELLEKFLSTLPKKFAEAKHDPDELANAACKEISALRPDMDIDQFERIADKLATTSGRIVFYHVKGDPDKLNAWIERTICP